MTEKERYGEVNLPNLYQKFEHVWKWHSWTYNMCSW